MYKVGELDWVAYEEDWCIVHHQVIVSVFRIEFDSKASWITLRIS